MDEQITPGAVMEQAASIFRSGGLSAKAAQKFCERSRYFSYLSREMQNEEAQRSVPASGFLKWLRECDSMLEKDKGINGDMGSEFNNGTSLDKKSAFQVPLVLLRFSWDVAINERPALLFAETVTRYFFSAAGQVNAQTSSTPVLHNLDLKDCFSLLRGDKAVSLDFLLSENSDGIKEKWTLQLLESDRNQVEISIGGTQLWQSTAIIPFYLSLQWLQTTFDPRYDNFVSALALLRDENGLHLRPGDDFGHSDTLDSITGGGALKYWDKAVRELSKPRWKESVAECTPHEKACLGLYRMIGEMLGESRRLHPRAEQYQGVIYQRQAAQRLLAMLEEYCGAMLFVMFYLPHASIRKSSFLMLL